MIGEAAWGIDLSGGSLKAVRISRFGGRSRITDVVDLPYSESGQGSQKLTSRLDGSVHRAIAIFLEAHGGELADPVYVGMHAYGAKSGETTLPTADPERAEAFLNYELHALLKGDPEDWIVCSSHRESRIREQDHVRFLAHRRALVETFVAQLDNAGLPVDGLVLEPLALQRYLTEEWAGREHRLVLQVQRTRTDLLLLGERLPRFRSVPIGCGGLTGPQSRAPSVTETRRLAKRLAHESTSAVEHFFAGSGFYPREILLIGEGAGIPALRHALGEELDGTVAVLERFVQLRLSHGLRNSASLDVIQMGTALGLALSALDRAPVSFNLIQPPAARRRARRRGALAAVMVLLSLALFVLHGLAHRERSGLEERIGQEDHRGDWEKRDEIVALHAAGLGKNQERIELQWRVADLRRQAALLPRLFDRLRDPAASFLRVRDIRLDGGRTQDELSLVLEVERGLSSSPEAVLEWARTQLPDCENWHLVGSPGEEDGWVIVEISARMKDSA